MVFVFIVSFIVFQIIKSTIGLRISKEAERLGTDKAEVGVIAYGIRDSHWCDSWSINVLLNKTIVQNEN